LDAGFHSSWLNGVGTGSNVIFTGVDKQAYQYILKHYNRHHKIPAVELFREQYPEAVYPLKSTQISIEELIELAADKVNSFLIADLITKTIDFHDEGRVGAAISLLKSEAPRIGTDIKYRPARADDLSDPEFDIDEFLTRTIDMGVPFGVQSIDTDFYGFQPGQLITLMGRQKSGKTTLTLNSALHAWEAGYDVLFFSVEMDLDLLRQRLLCLGAHVSPSRMRRGHLTETERKKVKAFHEKLTSDRDVKFFLSKKKSLITLDDIYAETAQYEPHVIYIDGFNFMLDRRTNKTADDWQANESLAAELKTFSLEEGRVILVNTQVQEKQYHPKFGIEAKTISSGTGLLKASDLVMGSDKTDYQHTLNCVLSRHEYFSPTVLEIDWDHMIINELVRDLSDVV
jgi:archaellum biogenesis ATPase FlaH